jgi:DNA-binding MarR family transcriptional regulator
MICGFDVNWESQQKVRFDEPVADKDSLRGEHVDMARAIYKARRRREREFTGMDLFSDPAWDILLTLVIDEADRRAVSVTSACLAACAPPTTGLRWLDKLELLGLVHREEDPFDRRRSYIRLSHEARCRMARALADYT